MRSKICFRRARPGQLEVDPLVVEVVELENELLGGKGGGRSDGTYQLAVDTSSI